MAPSELQPPLNFADGGAVGWAGDTTVYNTQSQIGNMLATPGGFSGMSRQFTAPSPTAMAEGGSVNNLATRLAQEFSKRGLDMNKMIAHRKAYAYGGDVRGGDNPGGLRGDTGAYSGRSIGSSQSVNAAMGRESPAQRDVSYGGGGGGSDRGGGGGREAPAYVSPTSDITTANLNAQRAAQEPSQVSFADSALNAINQLFGMGTAQAGTPAPTMMSVPQPNEPVYNDQGQLMGMTGRGRDYYTTRAGLPAIAFATSGGKSVPIGVSPLSNEPGPGAQQVNVAEDPLKMPDLRSAAEMALIQAQRANEAAAKQIASTPSGTYTASYNAPEADSFASQMANLQSKIVNLKSMPTEAPKESPFAALAQAKTYNRPFETEVAQSSGTPFSKIFDALVSPAAAAENKLNQIAQMTNTPWPGQSNAAANVPFPVPREIVQTETPPSSSSTFKGTSAKTTEQQAPALPAAKTTTPATQATDQGVLGKIMADINNANAKRIAELEKAGEFSGGNKAQVAAALGVDPSQLQSRIVNYDGSQKVDYFTKGLDQVLGDIVSGPFKALGNLFGGGNYDLKNGYSITPSGDVVPTPVYTPPTGGGGGGGIAQAPAPVQAAAAPAVTTPVSPALPQALASFKRKYVPLTNYATYGYGPESALYEYTAAEGGAVGPLSQKRK